LAGFGFVSKSHREALTLQKLAAAGLDCPEWIAHGIDHSGKAFLLIRELEGALELRQYLQQFSTGQESQRKRFIQRLAQRIATLHNAGFDQPDLYSKHILVLPGDERISIIDWQRSRTCASVPWRKRWRDLAVLSATVPERLLATNDRLLFLAA